MIYKRAIAKLRAQDWFAIGIEFAIVVAGVFVGTQVSNWNAGRIDQADTERLLSQLQPELRSQIDFFDTARAYYKTTHRFADTAQEGWAGDPSVSDNAFVVAAFQASQIQGVGTNSATWANIFGAERLRAINDPAIRRDLAFLMSSDNSTIGIAAVDTPYRQRVRRIIPIAVQEAIRARCGDIIPGDRPNVVIMPERCDIDLPPPAAAAAARALRSHPDLADDLNWQIAAEAAFLGNLEVFDKASRKLLREIARSRA